jgi:hypothetical protein
MRGARKLARSTDVSPARARISARSVASAASAGEDLRRSVYSNLVGVALSRVNALESRRLHLARDHLVGRGSR